MKVTIEEKGEELKFPCLMIAPESDCVVLFLNKNAGVVLVQGKSSWSVGHYSTAWGSPYANSVWKPYYGKIILEND